MPNPPHQSPPTQPAAGPPPGPVDPAGWPLPDLGRRIGAFLLDHLIVGLPYGTVMGTFFSDQGRTETLVIESPQTTMSFTLFTVTWMVVSTVYFAIGNGSRSGQTLGKKALSIQVCDLRHGGPIGIPRAAARYLIPGPLTILTHGITFVIDALVAIKDPQRIAVHDKLTNSLVVTTRPTSTT